MKRLLLSAVILTCLSLSFGQLVSAQSSNQMTLPNPPHNTVQCNSCHTAGPTYIPQTNDCLGCHGSYSELAQRTENKNQEFNPHYSHRGQEECTNCHSMHGKSQFICNDCHGFQMNNPNFQ